MNLESISRKLYKIGKIPTLKFFTYFGLLPALTTVFLYILFNPIRFQNLDIVTKLFAIPAFMAMYLVIVLGSLICFAAIISILLRVNTTFRERASKFIADSIVNNDEASAEFAERVAYHLNKIQYPDYFKKVQTEVKIAKIEHDNEELQTKVKSLEAKTAKLEKLVEQGTHSENNDENTKPVSNSNKFQPLDEQ